MSYSDVPFEVSKIDKEYSLGATAATKEWELKTDDPVHMVLATMKFLQNGATLETIAEVLTQFSTTLSIVQGGTDIVSMSATRLYWMLASMMPNGWAAHQTDGTGADNQYHAITLGIPLAPPDFPLPIHPEFGLDPANGTIVVKNSYPADGNKVDGRVMTLQAIRLKGATPDKVVRRIKRQIASPTASEDNYVDLPDGPNLSLLDLFMFHTTGLTAGTTSDVVTIDEFSMERGKIVSHLSDVYSLAHQHNLGNLSQTATSPAIPSTYLYMNMNRLGQYDRSIPLDKSTRLNFTCEDTNTLEVYAGVIRPTGKVTAE